jgi:hypothetical protein
MIFHINRMTFKAGIDEEDRRATLDAAREAGSANPAVRSFAVGHDIGGDFEWAAVYVVDDLDGYWAYLTHPAHVRSEMTGIQFTERFVAFDVTDSGDPEVGDKIARLQARHFQESPELAALVAQAPSFHVPDGTGVAAGAAAVNSPAGIDRGAPVRARHEIGISAPLEIVWRLHADVDSWPAWQKDVTAARLDGAFEAGGSFEWTSYGFTVTSTIYAVEKTAERARVLWGGTAGGITGIHEWVMHRTPGGVHVLTQESFSGETVEADPAGAQSVLDGSLTGWLERLKAAAESEWQSAGERERPDHVAP